MSAPRVSLPPWACECGRKVPAHVEACRCGKTRPEDVGAAGAAEWATRQAEAQPAAASDGLLSAKSLLQVGSVILLVGLFFGSRYFNRYRASNEVRAVMISELAKELGEETATTMVDKVHWACFEPNYQMSFKRRGGTPRFDDEKYGACAIRALEREAGQVRSARSKATLEEGRAAREARRQASEARAAASSQSAGEVAAGADPGLSAAPPAPRVVAISGLTVRKFDRATTSLIANFLVIGSGAEKFVCRHTLICNPGDQKVSGGTLPCLTPRDAVRADGELSFTRSIPAPAGPCELVLDLTDGSTGSSNRATLTIP